MAHPERVTAIVSQNGNAYEEGLGRCVGADPEILGRTVAGESGGSAQNILTLEGTRWQYTHGVSQPDSVPPESYTLDAALLERAGNKDIQLDLFRDYASNVKLYPAFQDYFRKAQPPLLAIWGKNDPFFLPAGAEAFRQGHAERASRVPGYRTFCARDARRRNCRRDEGVPRGERGVIMSSFASERHGRVGPWRLG